MTPEKNIIATIKTGEISPDDYDRILIAIGTVVAVDSLQITTVEVKPPKEKPVYAEIPTDMLGRLGTIGVEEFFIAIEAQGLDSQWATRLWNNLSLTGAIDSTGSDSSSIQRYGSLRIKNMTKNNKNALTGHVTLEQASKLEYSINLELLADMLIDGEINHVPNVGVRAVGLYHDVVQHRIGQILSEAEAKEAGTQTDQLF